MTSGGGASSSLVGNEPWFEALITSFSPCGNLMAIASRDTVVILKAKWNEYNQAVFNISARIELRDDDTYTVCCCHSNLFSYKTFHF